MELPGSFFKHDAQSGGFYPKSHVGIDVTDFGHHQNLLIEGIRGTGKTHILKMVEQNCIDNFTKNKIFPVYVSLAQINEHVRSDPDEFRLHLYTHIVQRCIETVQTYKESLQPNSTLLTKALDSVRRLFNLKVAPTFDELISQIKGVSETLRFELQYNLTSKNFKDSSSYAVTSSESDRFKGGVKAKVVEASGEHESKDEFKQSSQFEDNVMYVGSKLAHRNASGFLLEFLKQLQIILDLEHTLILLDECSEADYQAQVEIFRLFKSIRGCNSLLPDKQSCVHFIGSVYPQGGTYYPRRDKDGFNFEPGHDCSIEFTEWDELDQQTYLNFYSEMFLSRARLIVGYEGDFPNLAKEVFESYDGFLLAAFCSNGIPRRFWEILKRGYDKGTHKILTKGIEIAVQEIANDQVLSVGNLINEDIEFVNMLVDRIKNKNIEIRTHNNKHGVNWPQYIYFSINRQNRELIDRLIVQGAVHDKSRMRMKSKSVLKPIFSLDIALVYNFNVISQSGFVRAMTHDIPRCANNGFDQAIDIKNALILGVFGGSAAASDTPPHVISVPDDTDEGKQIAATGNDQQQLTGKIRAFTKGIGFINIDNSRDSVAFYLNRVDHDVLPLLKKGVRVRFDLMTKDENKRALAYNIDILP